MANDVKTPTVPEVIKPKAEEFEGARLVRVTKRLNRKRVICIFAGLAMFCLVYFSPPWGPAKDPAGNVFALTHEGKASLALFLLISTWWISEVIPLGVTGLAVGVVQTLFLIRPAKAAFGDFMDPSVCFIFGSIVIGMVFTKTGLTKRMAYKMLQMVGERTVMIYLGTFVLTAALTLIMAHTAVAATVFPLLMSIYALYDEDHRPTRFGKGLFIGMAFTAGAGSIVTLLGAARGAVGIGFYKDIVGREISFFQLTYYMLPVGLVMVLLLWIFFALVFKPERKTIPGLRERASHLYANLGPLSRLEITTLVTVFCVIALLGIQSAVDLPFELHKSAVILVATVLFFLFNILDIDDLENIPWNIILLFGGAMSIGFCLWETGAASWIAVKWLALLHDAPVLVFVMGLAFFVVLATNAIMNVAAIAITLPVAIVLGGYLGVAPEVILFVSLAAAGMPFLLLVGAAPNAIAYSSNQFTSKEFFMAGIPATAILMGVLTLFVWLIWPLMGMPVTIQP